MKLGNKLKGFLLLGTFVVMVMWGCATDKKGSIPLSKHPRPDFMRDAWVNLNGEWDFFLGAIQ